MAAADVPCCDTRRFTDASSSHTAAVKLTLDAYDLFYVYVFLDCDIEPCMEHGSSSRTVVPWLGEMG